MNSLLKQLILEGGNLFPDSERVTTEELNDCIAFVKSRIGKYFKKFESTKFLKSKQDHDDIDILVLPKEGIDISEIIKELGNSLIRHSFNGPTKSLFLNFKGKKIQVDLIVSGNQKIFYSKKIFFSYGDFWSLVGIISKRLNFNISDKGIEKIFEFNSRNHYIKITNNLITALKILGFKNTKDYKNIKELKDIVNFIKENDLNDSSFFKASNSKQKTTVSKRKNLDILLSELRNMNLKRKIDDEDFYLKKTPYYEKVLEEKEKIMNEKKKVTLYNGTWIMSRFPEIKGEKLGRVLSHLKNKFKDNLDNQNDQTIMNEIKASLRF